MIHLFLHLTQLYRRLILSSEQTPAEHTLTVTYAAIHFNNEPVQPNILSSVEQKKKLFFWNNQIILVTTGFHCMDKNNNNKKNVPRKKESHAGLYYNMII